MCSLEHQLFGLQQFICNVTGKREYPHVKELFNINPDANKLDQKQHESFHRCVGKLIYLAQKYEHLTDFSQFWVFPTSMESCLGVLFVMNTVRQGSFSDFECDLGSTDAKFII